jgi:hypothetical protein
MDLTPLPVFSYEDLHKARKHYDDLANTYKYRRFIPAWITGLIAGVVAVFFFALMIVYGQHMQYKMLFNSIEVISVFTSFILLTYVANFWHRKFLKVRRLAEMLRIHTVMADHGIDVSGKVIQVDNLYTRAHTDGKLRVIHQLQLGDGMAKMPDSENLRKSMQGVLTEQIRHHEDKRLISFRKRKAQVNVVLNCIKYVFLLVVLVKFLFECCVHTGPDTEAVRDMSHILSFYVIILPTLYAALEGVKHFSDWQRNITIAEQKIAELNIYKTQLEQTSDSEIRLLVERLPDILEKENVDWLSRYVVKKVGPLI